MKHVCVDTTGKIIQKFGEGVIPPPDAVAIQDHVWVEWVAGKECLYNGTDWIVGQDISIPLADEKVRKTDEMLRQYEAAMSAVTAGYSELEIKTWYKQESEARAVLTDPAAPTPFLSQLAASAGLNVQAFAQKVVTNADAYIDLSAAALAKKQAALAVIESATTTADVQAVVW